MNGNEDDAEKRGMLWEEANSWTVAALFVSVCRRSCFTKTCVYTIRIPRAPLALLVGEQAVGFIIMSMLMYADTDLLCEGTRNRGPPNRCQIRTLGPQPTVSTPFDDADKSDGIFQLSGVHKYNVHTHTCYTCLRFPCVYMLAHLAVPLALQRVTQAVWEREHDPSVRVISLFRC